MRKLSSLCAFILCALISANSQALTYEDCFKKASKRYGVPYKTLLAVAFTESSFRAHAVNTKLNRNGTGDYGFMQINSLWAKAAKNYGFSWHEVKTNPCTNVMFGAKILRQNYKRMKSWQGAIGAYNAGFSKSARAQATRRNYYNKVMRNKANGVRYAHRLRKRTSASSSYAKAARGKPIRQTYKAPVEEAPFSVAIVEQPQRKYAEEQLIEVSDSVVISSGAEVFPEGQVVSTAEGLVFEPIIIEAGEEVPTYVIGE